MRFWEKFTGRGAGQAEKLPVIKDYKEGAVAKRPLRGVETVAPKQKSNLEEFHAGRMSLTPEDERRIMKEAEAAGKDPEEALRAARKSMEEATKSLRDIRNEETRGGLIVEINKEFDK